MVKYLIFNLLILISVSPAYSLETPLELENRLRVPEREKFISQHSKLSTKIRSAIYRGEVILGMSADEAAAAGGTYIWVTSDKKLKQMTFNNLSQYQTLKPTGFVVVIENGVVAKIDRLNDLDACQDDIARGKPFTWKDVPYPFAGFWMEKCEDGFGLRFFPGGGGRYAVRFCGSGGCGKDAPNDCTLIPSEPKYRVVDSNTITITNNLGATTYKRCRP